MSTASGSRVAFHVYCHFLVAVEVAVEMAVDFQSGSRKKSGSRKVNNPFNPIEAVQSKSPVRTGLVDANGEAMNAMTLI